MFLGILTLLSALSISAVAIYYSVIGLTAIFTGARFEIIIMGVVLEIGKLISAVWLHKNWFTSPRSIKIYLSTALVVLMMITSMGIYGFLSKAHLEQSISPGDTQAKLSLLEEKILIQKSSIADAKKEMEQLNAAVDQTMSRSTSEQGASRSNQIRLNQQKERKRILLVIETAQKEILTLNEEKAPLAAQLRKVAVEVGPIRYIAMLFTDANDETTLEKAVTWITLMIVFVFDPLAIVMLIASQVSLTNIRRKEKQPEAPAEIVEDPIVEVVPEEITIQPVVEILPVKEDTFTSIDRIYRNLSLDPELLYDLDGFELDDAQQRRIRTIIKQLKTRELTPEDIHQNDAKLIAAALTKI